MESELSADKEKDLSSAQLKSYQWEDLRKARDAGGYPWTHLLKPPLQGEITAEDIIRETTPRRSMSREFSKSRTHSPVSSDVQKILNLDSSPGSSRKHGDEGEDEGVHIPNFSKELSLDEDDASADEPLKISLIGRPESQASVHLISPVELPKINISPKGILKRRVPDKQYIGVIETREKTKCCHPLVNKIKHLADKTLNKLDRSDIEKSPLSKRKKNEEAQEIRQLKSSPGAVRRQKFSAIKLGSSDEMSKSMCIDTPPPRKKKEHIYEDIDESKHEKEKSHQYSSVIDNHDTTTYDNKNNNKKEKEYDLEKKSNESQDPSLVTENDFLNSREHVMEKLHKVDNIKKEAILLVEDVDQEEPNVDEIFQNQLEEHEQKRESPNITITEITDDDEVHADSSQPATVPIETSPSPSPLNISKRKDIEFVDQQWSKPSSDHEYEIIEKPPPNIVYTSPSLDEKPMLVKTDDDLSSTTSLERKYLQHTSDEEEQTDDKDNTQENNSEGIKNAEALQKDIEDRFFVNTPSTVSRTECEVSTSQVDSSALEQLPLKRDSRSKNFDGNEKNLHQRFKDSTGKLKIQAGKLKMKLQNIKTNKLERSERSKINSQQHPKFKMPERAKFSLPERPKFTLPDKRKFSLPDRPKFKKFTLPERPKLNVPDFPKFKMPDRPKINFPSLRRKKEYKIETDTSNSMSDLKSVTKVDFEAKTYPRLFSRKKKTELKKTSSSPILNREETPPPTFTFEQFKKCKEDPTSYIPDSPEQPREYGTIDNGDIEFDNEMRNRRHFETTYDFDKLGTEYMDDEPEISNFDDENGEPDVSPSKQEYTHVITEINNDEFFVRPRGISREDIQVREYLNDETRQAFKNPKNILALMGKNYEVNIDDTVMNDLDINPEPEHDDNEPLRYSSEDLNDRDDGYYTFPPVRPSRAKRKKTENEVELTTYIDDSVHTSMQFSEVDLSVPEDMKQMEEQIINNTTNFDLNDLDNKFEFTPSTDLHSIHEYANDDVIQYPENLPIQSQTLPMPPKRKKKFGKKDFPHSSLNDFNNVPSAKLWEEPEHQHTEDIIVYRTEHEYVIPRVENAVTEQSPLPPRRNRSRSSRGTSLCDDDRTSQGADSLTLDTHVPPIDDIDSEREMRQESPGYATVDKSSYIPSKGIRRSISQTPPIRRKSNSSERKYYTVGANKESPDRPPRKKSSNSLMTLDSFIKHSVSGDITQYVEIDEPFEAHKKLNSGDVVNKMKDRPLPPPPRPPRGSRRSKNKKNTTGKEETGELNKKIESLCQSENGENVIEIEVSTQTDPLPDDVDFELGIEDNLDISMSSSLRDIADDDSLPTRSHIKVTDSSRHSRPTSRSEKSFKLSDPKISEFSKPNIGRTSPTVILVEKRVSSPTRINEREEMLTEASLTVQHIDVDESQIPDVPPLPRSRGIPSSILNSKTTAPPSEQRTLERIVDANRDVQLDNLVTKRLQVRDLDVGRLNVSELQANKILVSDIEGMTLQVTELDSKSGHISVSGIEFSQSVIDEIVKKFAEISTSTPLPQSESQRPISREEETQTDELAEKKTETKSTIEEEVLQTPSLPTRQASADEGATPPQRPPPPDLTPLLYSYLQDITIPPASLYPSRSFRERPFTEFYESQHQTPPPPTRRTKRKPATPHTDSSSEDGRLRPSPRRMPSSVRPHEPTIIEAGAQFLRVCQNSISRTIRNIFNSFMTYISGAEDKKDVQMALVIFLVLIAGLLMFGLSDSRTIHHHHWDFFNPSDGNH